MRVASSSVIVALAAVSGANALSSSCTTSVAGLAFGDLGSCLQLTKILSLFSNSEGSILDSTESYLSSLCSSSTPTCSNSTLTSASSTISSSCSSDLSGGGSSAAEIIALQSILNNYDEVYTAACSKNSTTNDYCLVDSLGTVQNYTGTNVSISTLTGLLSGSGTSSLNSTLSSGQLCTGCNAEIYQQALAANSSIADTVVGKAIASACGSSYATASVTGVSSAVASSTSSSSSSSGSSSGAISDFDSARFAVPVAIVLAGVFGGATLL